MAGKTGRQPCYLLATEGDSAKDLAVCGMEIVGRDHYGVIPLRGVIRNVRPAKVNAKVRRLPSRFTAVAAALTRFNLCSMSVLV